MSASAPVFDVPWLSAFGSKLLARHGALLEKLGVLETRFLQDQILPVDTSRPIFVCGLARSGTTVLLELIASHSSVASQRYLDFPFVFTPFFWNRYLGFARRKQVEMTERSHKDGLMVSPESPEAMEEPLWMRFFGDAHDPSVVNVLDREVDNKPFEEFYDAHIAKLLAVRNRSRYVAKGNYHIARLRYLHRLYPQANFVIPVRDPVNHIASSMKQHSLFMRGQEESLEARLYLTQVGHFEFGLDRRPINTDPERTDRIISHWAAGDEIGGWAEYWAMIHDHIAGVMESDLALRKAVSIVSYEELCARPTEYAETVREFCGLDHDPEFDAFAHHRIKPQVYYRPAFTEEEITRITSITRPSKERVMAHSMSPA